MIELAFNSRMLNIYNLSDMNKIVDLMISHMVQQIENLALKDSKVVFNEVMHMDIDFHRFNLMRGSSYLPLPDWLAHKKALINPKNLDLECFKWAVIAAMRWEEIGENPNQITKLERFENNFNWTGVGFPALFRTIKGFDSQNQISINVLAVENRQIYICRKGVDHYDRIANLMLNTENNHKHYVAIKSLSRLLSKQNRKHKEAQRFCMNCLQGFREERSRDEHVGYCKNNEAVQIEMAHKNPIVQYLDGQLQFKAPFIMYADFESILEPIQGPGNDPSISSTRGVNVHTPSGWCIYSHFAYGKVTNPLAEYRGPDCVSKFCKHIIAEAHCLYESFPEKPMEPLTKAQMKEYKHAI